MIRLWHVADSRPDTREVPAIWIASSKGFIAASYSLPIGIRKKRRNARDYRLLSAKMGK